MYHGTPNNGPPRLPIGSLGGPPGLPGALGSVGRSTLSPPPGIAPAALGTAALGAPPGTLIDSSAPLEDLGVRPVGYSETQQTQKPPSFSGHGAVAAAAAAAAGAAAAENALRSRHIFLSQPQAPNQNMPSAIQRNANSLPAQQRAASIENNYKQPITNTQSIKGDDKGPPVLKTEDSLLSVCVMDVAPAISDEWMERICQTASSGSLVSWWRGQKPRGDARSWGLATFTDPGGLRRFSAALNSSKLPDIQQHSDRDTRRNARSSDHDERRTSTRKSQNHLLMQPVKLIIDSRTKRLVDEWERNNAQQVSKDNEDLGQIQENLNAIIDELRSPSVVSILSSTSPVNDHKENDDKKLINEDSTVVHYEDEDVELADDDNMALIYREIALFRERSAKRDRINKQMEDNYERIRTEFEAQSASKSRRNSHSDKKEPVDLGEETEIFKDLDAFSSSSSASDGLSDSELKFRNEEAREDDIEKRFINYEHHWIQREKSRASALERELKRDQEKLQDLEAIKRRNLEKLGGWNDAEDQRVRERHFYDRTGWLRMLAREHEEDHKDRIRERQELQADIPNESHLTRRKNTESSNDSAKIISGFSLNFNKTSNANKRSFPNSALSAAEKFLDEDEDDSGKRTALLERIKASEEEHDENNEEAREQRVKEIAASIPSDKDGVFSLEIKWDELSKVGRFQDYIEMRLTILTVFCRIQDKTVYHQENC